MQSPSSQPLKVALLGMSDNAVTQTLLAELAECGVACEVVILQVPDFRTNLRRLKRKLLAGGLKATLQRVFYALRSRGSYSGAKETRETIVYVRDPNGQEIKDTLQSHDIDVLLLSTDSMISRDVFLIPNRATLNAHPGKIPQYRGLGGLVAQVARGVSPSMSVHQVNEGVDTGPVLRRSRLPDEVLTTDAAIREALITQTQAKMFAKVLEDIRKGRAIPIDTFTEASNMTRGIPAKDSERAWIEASVCK